MAAIPIRITVSARRTIRPDYPGSWARHSPVAADDKMPSLFCRWIGTSNVLTGNDHHANSAAIAGLCRSSPSRTRGRLSWVSGTRQRSAIRRRSLLKRTRASDREPEHDPRTPFRVLRQAGRPGRLSRPTHSLVDRGDRACTSRPLRAPQYPRAARAAPLRTRSARRRPTLESACR